jgi:NlpC/P60 family putative phage cell wall peptidase
MTEQETRAAIVAEAKSWLKTPYHHAAHIKGVGVDCIQILNEVYSAVGIIERQDIGYYATDYMMHQDEERYLKGITDFTVPVAKPQAGDIALFKFGRCISHSGIMVDEQNFIHAYSQEKSVCYGNIFQGPIAKRLVGFYSAFGK